MNNIVAEQVKKLPIIKTIAVIGLSDNPARYSYEVSSYLQKRDIIILPVNPYISEVFGERAYKNIRDIPRDILIDVVLMYRKSEEILPHVKEVIERGGITTIWLPEGVKNEEAEALAEKNNITVVSDFCIMKEHKKSENSN